MELCKQNMQLEKCNIKISEILNDILGANGTS